MYCVENSVTKAYTSLAVCTLVCVYTLSPKNPCLPLLLFLFAIFIVKEVRHILNSLSIFSFRRSGLFSSHFRLQFKQFESNFAFAFIFDINFFFFFSFHCCGFVNISYKKNKRCEAWLLLKKKTWKRPFRKIWLSQSINLLVKLWIVSKLKWIIFIHFFFAQPTNLKMTASTRLHSTSKYRSSFRSISSISQKPQSSVILQWHNENRAEHSFRHNWKTAMQKR